MAKPSGDGLSVYQRYYRRHIEKRRKEARERLTRWRTENPEKYRQQTANWRVKNKERILESARRWRQKNPEKTLHRPNNICWAKRLKREYGLTPSMYADMLTLQEGRCAICRTAEPGGIGSWHIDHDHSTKRVRGLLCNRCNMALGLFRDNADLLLAARFYLEKAKAMEVSTYVQ